MHDRRARQPSHRRSHPADGRARHVLDSNNHLDDPQLHGEQARTSSASATTPRKDSRTWSAASRRATTRSSALAAKVKMVFGTDATAGAHGRNAEELIYRVKDGGQTPMDAIVTATSRSAESLRLGDQIGTIAPGMEADIVADRRQSAAGHHRGSAGDLRHEGRQGRSGTRCPRRRSRHPRGRRISGSHSNRRDRARSRSHLRRRRPRNQRTTRSIGSWKLNVAKSTFTPGPPIKGGHAQLRGE